MQAKDIPIKTSELLNSLGTIGSHGSILTGTNGTYSMKSKANSWSLSSAQVTQYLTQAGGDILGDGLNKCSGTYIAAPGYMMSINSKLNDVNSELNDADVIKQNSNEIISQNGVNNQLETLNLNSSVNNGAFDAINQNKLVFQSNSGCVMDPSKLSTMQDYDADCPGSGCQKNDPLGHYASSLWNRAEQCPNIDAKFGDGISDRCDSLTIPNKFGCRNQQLSVGVQEAYISDPNGGSAKTIQAVAISGFEKVSTSKTTNMATGYLGGLTADSIQATAQLGYGDACVADEIGSMALQKKYAGNTALEKLYNLNQSLLVCQKSLLCKDSILGSDGNPSDVSQCWLPISTTSADITFSMSDKVLSFKAPSGFYIKPGSVVYQKRDDNLNNVGTGGKRYGGLQPGNHGGNVSSTLGNMHCEGEHKTGPFDIITCGSTGYFILPDMNHYNSIGVFARPELLNQSTLTQLKGFNIWQDSDNIVSFDAGGSKGYTGGKFFTSSGLSNTRSYATQNFEQGSNWVKRLQDSEFKFGSTFPYIANSKWDIYQTVYNADSGCDAGAHCDSWHSAAIVSIPYYITKLTLSNDTDNLSVDSATPPDAPPEPDRPSGTCTNSNIPNYMIQEINDASTNDYYDSSNNYTHYVPASPPNINNISTNVNSYSCNVVATANYCPAQSSTGCKYDVNISMLNGNKLKYGDPCMGQTWKAMSSANNGDRRVDEYCGNPQRHCSYTANRDLLNQWVPLSCNDGGMGNYMTTITEGSCAPANQCSNPITREIYNRGYSL